MTDPTPQQLVYEGRDLEAMSHAERYHRWILDMLRPYLGTRLLEAGAGAGDVAALLADLLPAARILALEPSENVGPRLLRRFAGHPRIAARQAYLADVAEERQASLDAILYINVLEHVEDDAGELSLARACLRPGGHVCVFVPALPWLYSDFDRRLGHYRRYTRASLRGAAQAAGLEVVRLHYCDLPGILPWLVLMKWFGGSLRPAAVASYDRLAVPVIRLLEGWLRPPLGKNLLLVARRSAADAPR
jgi:SAM-dependent methyltransferase